MAKKEYPKWVETADKKRVIVKNKDEETKVLGQVESPNKPEKEPKKPKADWSN